MGVAAKRWSAMAVACAAAVLAGVVVPSAPVAAEPPAGDPAYGSAGTLVAGRDPVLDAEGRLLTVRRVYGGPTPVVRVERFTAAGLPDPTWTISDVPWSDEVAHGDDLLVDGQGRVVLVVRRAAVVDVYRFVDGVLDPTFSGDGALTLTTDSVVPGGASGADRPVGLDGQDRLVLAFLASPAAGVVRLTDAGALDPTFSGDGVAPFACCGSDAADRQPPRSLAHGIRPDGSVVLAITTSLGFPGSLPVALDVSSAGVPRPLVPLSTVEPLFRGRVVSGAAVDGEGRLLVWGQAPGPPVAANEPFLQRLTADLVLDETFGTAGSASLPTYVRTVVPHGDGVLVVHTYDELLDLTEDGYPNPSFGTGGRSTRTAGAARPVGSSEAGLTVAVDPDGGFLLIERLSDLEPGHAPFPSLVGYRMAQVLADGSWPADRSWSAPPLDYWIAEAYYPQIEHDGAAVVLWLEEHGPDDGGRPSGYRRVPLAPGLGRPSPVVAPFGSPGPLVDRLFADLVWRAPTAAERSTVAPAISAGTETAAGLVSELVDDPERSAVVDPVVRLYRAHFQRPADSSGLRHWVAVRRGGATVASIAARFSRSTEFVRTYGALSNRAFVELVYRNVFGRAGDAAGIAFWTGRLDRGRAGRGQVMASMSESTEHQRRTRAEVVTTSVHLGLLDRAPTAGELAAWAPTVATAPDPLVAAVLASSAWQQRVG